jgi:hypothetical protein
MNLFQKLKAKIFSPLATKPINTCDKLDDIPYGTYVVLELNKDLLSQLKLLGTTRFDQQVLDGGILQGLIKSHYTNDEGTIHYLEIIGIPAWGRRWEYVVYQHEIKKVRQLIRPTSL